MQWKDTSSVAGMAKKTAVCKRNMLYVWVLHNERNGWTQNEISQVKDAVIRDWWETRLQKHHRVSRRWKIIKENTKWQSSMTLH